MEAIVGEDGVVAKLVGGGTVTGTGYGWLGYPHLLVVDPEGPGQPTRVYQPARGYGWEQEPLRLAAHPASVHRAVR